MPEVLHAVRRDLFPNGEVMPALAEQFHAAADGARTLAQLEEIARLLWRAHADEYVLDSA